MTLRPIKKEKEGEEKEEKKKKPTLKLASIANMTEEPRVESTENGMKDDQAGEGGCNVCNTPISSLKQAVVWETMQFLTVDCLREYQSRMNTCSSCKSSVNDASLEDYKKGLKVCSYCQKDISDGSGFLAPIGNKGQFKDFCEAKCLKSYEVMNGLKEAEVETLPCAVCKETKLVEFQIVRADETIKLCGSGSCPNAYKFANNCNTEVCPTCKKFFDTSMLPRNTIYHDGKQQSYCSKACLNVSIMVNRKIVPCTNCRVKKYNFDMIEIYEDGDMKPASMYCSLHCRSLMNRSTTPSGVSSSNNGFGSLPVISAYSTLAPQMAAAPSVDPKPVQQPAPIPQPPQIQVQTVKELVKETQVLPPEMPTMTNKGLQTKPFMVSKSTSAKPVGVNQSTQTDAPVQPTIIPLPVPINIPTPCKMYNAPFPVPVPIPLPFPVPIFIPTTRHSMKGIEKIIKKILNKIPADPFEAELLALAGNMADEDKDSDSEEDVGDDDFDDQRT